MKIGIISMGNATSVQNALRKIGVESIVTRDRAELEKCAALIIPGVGSFASGIKTIKNLIPLIKKWNKPLLGICLGMQLLFESSEESPGVKGLGLVKGTVKKFIQVRTPQIGWNQISVNGSLFDKNGYVYFVNSYYCVPNESVASSTTDYGITFVSSIKKDNLYGVQFHPEKSGEFGLLILRRFVRLCK